MKHSQEEIVNALKVIKETCEECKECETCPLDNEYLHKCEILRATPDKWEIKEQENIWRAFNG